MININALKKLYTHTPQGLRDLALLFPPAQRISPDYHRWRSHLRRARTDPEWCDEFRKARLKSLLMSALNGSPRYEKLAAERGFIQLVSNDPFSALQRFPIVCRSDLAADPDSFIVPRRTLGGSYIATSGGTTGKPIAMRHSNGSWGAEWAFVFDYLDRFSITDIDKRLSLRGVRFGGHSKPFEENPVYRELRVSPFHLSSRHIDEIAARIVSYRPKYIHCYASSLITLLGLLGSSAEQVLRSVELVLCVSEEIPAWLSREVDELIGVPLASFYGMTERVSFVEFVPKIERWVPNLMYGVTEVLDGRIVGTGFLNTLTPLVRYDTGDDCELDASGVIQRIKGRWTQVALRGKSGGEISMTALNLHCPEFAELGEFQLVQDEPGFANVCFLNGIGRDRAASVVARAFTSKCEGEIIFHATCVDAFVLTGVGKRPLVVQRLARKTSDKGAS